MNQTVQLTLNITSAKDVENVTVLIRLSEGLGLANGSITWTGDLAANQTIQINSTLRPAEAGNLSIYATINSASTEPIRVPGLSVPARPIATQMNITMEEWCRDMLKRRTYEASLWGGSIYPQPRKGTNSTSYFRSLNLTGDVYYVLMQFEDCDGDPSREEQQILKNSNVSLYEYHGDHTYYARTPRIFLESTSYDFVRWIELPERINASWKIFDKGIREFSFRNCTGTVNISVSFYDGLTDDQQSNSLLKGLPEANITKII